MVKVKPIIKWVGAKNQIMDDIINKVPKNFENYHEIFLGSGSVLINILNNKEITFKKAYAYDINETLINMFIKIQQDPLIFIQKVTELIDLFNKNDKEAFYYKTREEYNSILDKKCVDRCCRFLFLNKTCFRGLYRESSTGRFNVSYGYNKNPSIMSSDEVLALSKLIQNVSFECLSFKESLKKVSTGDFVYLDPPYVGPNFIGYTSCGFPDHEPLFKMVNSLPCKFLMSNSNSELVSDSFKNCNIVLINCKRRINSKNPAATVDELLVFN